MGVDDGDQGYGFARRGRLPPKKAGRRTAVPASPVPSAQPKLPHPPVLAGDRAPFLQKPPWVWMLIGVLLGTGGTLLTASFWLPEGEDRQIAELQTNDQLPPENSGVAVAAEPMSKENEPTRGEPSAGSPSAAALDAVELSAAHRMRSRKEGEILPDHTRTADAPGTDARRDSPKPASVLDNAEPDPVVAGTPPAAHLDPGRALEALASKAASDTDLLPEVNEPAAGPRLDPPTPADGAKPDPDQTTLAAVPVTAISVDDALPAASPPPETAKIESSDDIDRAELPPHIRRALQAANNATKIEAKTRSQSASRLYRVQLAAVDDEASARLYWREANERLPSVFADVEPIFDQRVVGERLYLRIWVGAFDSRRDADGYCAELKEQGQDCFVTRVDNL